MVKVGAFPEVFDSSMLAMWKSCPQLFYQTHIEHFKPKEPSIHLHAGKAFASGIERAREAFYNEGKDADTALAEGMGKLIADYGDFQCPPDSAKSCERMAGALEFYFDQWPLSHQHYPPVTLPNGKRGIEFSFACPIDLKHPETGNPLIYCGRLDALLQLDDTSPGAYITDEKTTSSLGATWSRQWDLRSQFTGYAWGCRESGIRTDGVIVRGISILKTKYDCQQAISHRPDWQLDRWYSELLDWIVDIQTAWERKRWRHNLDSSCADYGGCGFKMACSSEDPSPWIETYFERRRWNPILRTEDQVEL